MNLEQAEGQLSEFDGCPVSIILPIRGTVVQSFFGTLKISHNWDDHIILYSVKFYPDTEISFQAQDVEKIIPRPNDDLDANIILKSDTWMEQSKLQTA